MNRWLYRIKCCNNSKVSNGFKMEDRCSYSQSLLRNTANGHAEDGSVDVRGSPVSKPRIGGWKASLFIIGVEVAERFSFYGIDSNLITYFTNVLHQSTATGAKNVNIWAGFAATFPLLGAFVADAYLGRYCTIIVATIVYLGGLIWMTVSTFFIPPCTSLNSCPEATPFQIGGFFVSLYIIAVGTGGHKPCIEAFGADQFDDEDPEERKQKSSFFNWWFFSQCGGAFVAFSLLLYIQDNLGWGLGFGIPAVCMAVSLCVFLYGSRFYRHKLSHGTTGSPATQSKNNVDYGKNLAHNNRKHCTLTGAEDVKLILRLVPIWVTCLMYGVIYAQCETLFTKQGSTMDRKIGAHFQIPPAALQLLIALTILTLLPVYDWILVPLARHFTGIERGITLLQRIGIGLFFSILTMVVAALTEMERLKVAKDNGLVDMPHATIPLGIFWLFPQYIIFGISEVFTMAGMQEYFYDQVPDTMKSLGMALYLTVFGVGSFLSSIIISIVEKVSSRGKEQSWFADNLNEAHLDYFYWLLFALSSSNFCIYISFARCYTYKKVESGASSYEEASC